MKNAIFAFILLLAATACQTAKGILTEVDTSIPEESITLSINETTQYKFTKWSGRWQGEMWLYAFGKDDEKTVTQHYFSTTDSSWADFDEIVRFLELYAISPQNELPGWHPDSGRLPREVYAFEVFDGRKHQSYSYQDPINDLRNYWQAQNILTFVAFVQTELTWVKPD